VSVDFYVTAATVLPVLLLALIWDSHALETLKVEDRQLRKNDPDNGVLFWTKPRVRVYTLFVATAIVLAVALCILRIAGAVPEGVPVRTFVLATVILTLGTVLTRIWVDVIAATSKPAAASSTSGSDERNGADLALKPRAAADETASHSE
jgi:hypothetical protein